MHTEDDMNLSDNGIWTRYFWKRAAENAIGAGAAYGITVISLWQADAVNTPSTRTAFVAGGIILVSVLRDVVQALKTRTSEPSIVADHAMKNGGIPIPNSDEVVQLPQAVQDEYDARGHGVAPEK